MGRIPSSSKEDTSVGKIINKEPQSYKRGKASGESNKPTTGDMGDESGEISK